MNEQALVPELRFDIKDANYRVMGFSELGDIKIGLTHKPDYVDSGVPFLSSKNISEGFIDFDDIKYITEEKFDSMPPSTKPKVGDILFTRVGSNLGNPIILEDDIEFGIFVSLGFFRVKKSYSNKYVRYWMDSNYFWRQVEQKVAGGAKNNLNSNWLKEFTLSVPVELDEQQKIADFLSSVDKKISLLKDKHRLLVQYKKGVMQQIFSQQIRFKDDNGQDFPDWEEVKLSELLYEHKIRNESLDYKRNDVLSVSGDLGVVNQIEHLGRSYAGESVHNYHVLHQGDIVYTKSPLKANPYGIIKANKGPAGIVSTLYAVYTPKERAHADYLDYYFWLDDNVNRYLRPLVNKGAKNDMKINNQRVLIDPIACPCLEEQKKISRFLDKIDQKIKLINQQVNQAQTYKKGLLQKMFV